MLPFSDFIEGNVFIFKKIENMNGMNEHRIF